MTTLQGNLNSFELSYAGIPFQVSEPEVEEWIRSRIPRQYLQEIVPPPDWISRTMMSLALPGQAYPVPPLDINEFFYPTGASRWAQGHFLATESAALKMIAAAYSHSAGAVALPFVMNAPPAGMDGDRDPNPGLTTNLFMLPPRPLLQVDKGLDGLYLVTLVDERYYSYLNHTTQQFDNATTWSAYITAVAAALGITSITIPAISPAYGSPSLDSSLWSTAENAAYLLDAAAWNVCTTVVRNFDGSYTLKPHSDTSYFNTRPRFGLAGGAFSDALDSSNLIPTLEAVLPASVNVTFPKYWSFYGYIDQTGTVAKPGRYNPRVNEPYLDVVTKTIAIAHSTASDVQGNPISSYHGIGTKTLRTSGKAYFTNFTDTTALNDSDLQSLAQLLADNYWAYTALGMDEVYLGIRGWQPEGAHDVLWTYRKDRPTTRVMRKPWNFWPVDFQHELVPNSGNHDGANAGNPGTELLFCNTSTPDGSSRYDAFISTKTNPGGPGSLTQAGGEEVWLHAANGENLTSGTVYLGRLMTIENGRKIFDTVTSPSVIANAYRLGDTTIISGAQAYIAFTNLGTRTPSGFTIGGIGNRALQLPSTTTNYLVGAHIRFDTLAFTSGYLSFQLQCIDDNGTTFYYHQLLSTPSFTTVTETGVTIVGFLRCLGINTSTPVVQLFIDNESNASIIVDGGELDNTGVWAIPL